MEERSDCEWRHIWWSASAQLACESNQHRGLNFWMTSWLELTNSRHSLYIIYWFKTNDLLCRGRRSRSTKGHITKLNVEEARSNPASVSEQTIKIVRFLQTFSEYGTKAVVLYIFETWHLTVCPDTKAVATKQKSHSFLVYCSIYMINVESWLEFRSRNKWVRNYSPCATDYTRQSK